MTSSVVIMGVAGCGKSHVGRALASARGWRLIEGDDFHSLENLTKMSLGIALTDSDRGDWLAELGALLKHAHAPVVLTCSALKRQYREQLRAASPGLGFVFLQISREEALARVAARSSTHFFPIELVDSQFAVLESPVSEPQTLALDATLVSDEQQRLISDWLGQGVGV